MKKIKWIFLVAVIGATAMSYLLVEKLEDNSPLPVYGLADHKIPAFEFVNQNNETITSESLKGKIWIVNYFFTSCPSICPKMTRNLQLIHDVLRQDDEVQMMSFTVDPKRDDPQRLKKFSSAYNVDDEHWYFLTGAKKELYSLARKGFLLSASDGAGDEFDFIHSENVVLVDQAGKIRGLYVGTDPDSIRKCLADINKLK